MPKRKWIRKLDVGNDTDDMVALMAPDQLKQVQTLKVADTGGWQRKLNQKKVRAIADRCLHHGNWCRFQPIQLAFVDDVLYDIDGQHRRHGHIRANKNALVQIIVCDLETAKKNFLLHNSTATRVSAEIQIAASDNPTAREFKRIMADFDISETQLRSFIGGLSVGLGSMRCTLNLIDDDAKMDLNLKTKTRRVLAIWTSGKYWQCRPKGMRKPAALPTGYYYSLPGILRTVGMVSQDYDKNLEGAIEALRKPSRWIKGSKITDIHGDGYQAIKRTLAWFHDYLRPLGIPADDLLRRNKVKATKKRKTKTMNERTRRAKKKAEKKVGLGSG